MKKAIFDGLSNGHTELYTSAHGYKSWANSVFASHAFHPLGFMGHDVNCFVFRKRSLYIDDSPDLVEAEGDDCHCQLALFEDDHMCLVSLHQLFAQIIRRQPRLRWLEPQRHRNQARVGHFAVPQCKLTSDCDK